LAQRKLLLLYKAAAVRKQVVVGTFKYWHRGNYCYYTKQLLSGNQL
jgi:hypothetical protein